MKSIIKRFDSRKRFTCLRAGAVAALFAVGLAAAESEACSRVVYSGLDSLRIVGRSLDWKTPIPTNIYVYPRGMEKQSSDRPDAIRWTSKYGAVYAVGYDGGITEGMNEKGLCINGLFCKGTVYENESTKSRPPMSMAMFVGWLLDLNATTDEVVAVLKRHDFNIGGATFDGGTVSALHWGITDASGKSAILEFDHGEVRIYDEGDLSAMTNDPNWPQMQAIISYWDKIGGKNMLPGTVSSPDRCVRGHYFVNHVEKTGDRNLGVSILRSVMGICSVPYTYTVEGEPNISSTQWRSYANLRDLVYYFDIVTNEGIFYVDLKKCNLRKGSPVLKLDTSKSGGYVGDATGRLKKDKGFTPMY